MQCGILWLSGSHERLAVVSCGAAELLPHVHGPLPVVQAPENITYQKLWQDNVLKKFQHSTWPALAPTFGLVKSAPSAGE